MKEKASHSSERIGKNDSFMDLCGLLQNRNNPPSSSINGINGHSIMRDIIVNENLICAYFRPSISTTISYIKAAYPTSLTSHLHTHSFRCVSCLSGSDHKIIGSKFRLGCKIGKLNSNTFSVSIGIVEKCARCCVVEDIIILISSDAC